MLACVFLTFLVTLAGQALSGHAVANYTSDGGEGDMYVMAYAWVPESCYGNPSYKGCQNPNSFWKTNFVMKGLWSVSSSTGGQIQSCSDGGEPYDREVALKVGWDDLVHYWPNVELLETDSDFQELWMEAWETHGRCSGLTQYDYFKTALNQFKLFPTPHAVEDAISYAGGVMEKDTLQEELGGPPDHSVLLCHNMEYVSEVYTCWSRAATDGKPEMQISCPDSIRNEDTCSSGVVAFMAF